MQPLDHQPSNLPPGRLTRSSRRTGALSDQILTFQDNPESILRKSRKTTRSKANERNRDSPKQKSPNLADLVSKKLEAQRGAGNRRLQISLSDDSSDNQLSEASTAEDPEQKFNYEWGYLPPFDEEIATLIEDIIANPDMAERYFRIGAENDEFELGLMYRNVSVTESSESDPCLNEVKECELNASGESEYERQSHGQLWTDDWAACKRGSSEAFFQRTLMMSLVGRHYLIYKSDDARKRCLDFSVEEPWTCPPMPTRAFILGKSFLTAPKPDLAVCFRRDAVISDKLWVRMPKSMQSLACYEKESRRLGKIFHFFTIEAKKGLSTDIVAQRQSLNNASQSLHNMFEFFREADQENTFYEKVRFFSVVATSDGLLIRIHRAEKESDPDLWIMSQKDPSITPRDYYPLRFRYKIFAEIDKREFERRKVLDIFERILIGYGVKQLLPLLKNAADSIHSKFPVGSSAMALRANDDYYRYNQAPLKTNSRRQTPKTAYAQSVRSDLSLATQPRTDMPPPSRQTSIPRSVEMEDISGQGASFMSVRSSSATTTTGKKRAGQPLEATKGTKHRRSGTTA